MLSYFYQNKLRYEKGQMAPFFIALLAILIIMAMVTVNLSKVSFIKTDSSNAADAGALAAGSVMANVFNGLAEANSQMETSYWEFYAGVSISFAIALGALIAAHLKTLAAIPLATAGLASAVTALGLGATAVATAFVNPAASAAAAAGAGAAATAAIASLTAAGVLIKAAMFWMQTLIFSMWSILIATTAYAAAQLYYYGALRKMVDEGRENGIMIGHKFAFINSGTGAKLKDGKPESGTADAEKENNYRNNFSKFLDKLGDNSKYTYSWQDGLGRGHYVEVNMGIDPVESYDLKVAALPLVVEIPLMTKILALGTSALVALGATDISYDSAGLNYVLAQISYYAASALEVAASVCFACRHAPFIGAICTACWIALATAAKIILAVGSAAGIVANAIGKVLNLAGLATNGSAAAIMASMYPLIAISWAGLLPGWVYRSSSMEDAIPFIICWIEDVAHNHLVRVDVIQHHAGQELGLWQMNYPEKIQSYSIVNFSGRGKIHPPKLRFDPSIVETDNKSGIYDPCPLLVQRTKELSEQEEKLYESAESLEEEASQIEKEAETLRQKGMTQEADGLAEQAALLRSNANQRRVEAAQNAELAESIKEANPSCFGGG